ncbi:uncharacterized protein BXZ73DRAFT_102744 [Epithele typhae]|uniref:uncharacterized protein n=1 Tax=Epithele typhae TaxID=378194 RepID=UPI00200749F4|nr:uncharacterized protein BXZ73DRAFT_102744 [Epithele typhae]KAH9927155.1 hypothetical protein BXZ73DRAFT_102744 [Epithele typhae]
MRRPRPPLRLLHPRPTYPTLAACALASKAWLPRSRAHLYRAVCLSSLEQADRITRTVRDQPWIGELVKTLQLIPPSGSAPSCLSFVPDDLVSRLPNIQTLSLPTDFYNSQPLRFQRLAYQFPLTELRLVKPGSAPAVIPFQLLWTLPNLSSLHLRMEREGGTTLNPHNLERLLAKRKTVPFGTLTHLSLEFVLYESWKDPVKYTVRVLAPLDEILLLDPPPPTTPIMSYPRSTTDKQQI